MSYKPRGPSRLASRPRSPLAKLSSTVTSKEDRPSHQLELTIRYPSDSAGSCAIERKHYRPTESFTTVDKRHYCCCHHHPSLADLARDSKKVGLGASNGHSSDHILIILNLPSLNAA